MASTTLYRLYKDVAIPDNGSHDTYYFVNTTLGSPPNLFCISGDEIPIGDTHLYSDEELTLLESMQSRNVFNSRNGACITVVRVDNVSQLEPYEVEMS